MTRVPRQEAERALQQVLTNGSHGAGVAPETNGQVGPALPAITPIDFATLPDAPPAPRSFLIESWLFASILSSLHGPPGVGKTLLAQQIATCLATDTELFGLGVQRTPVLGLFSEDDNAELERRQWYINQHYGLKNADLKDLHLEGRSGLENGVVNFPGGSPHVEPLFESIVARAKSYGAGLLILDNRAQMILGNENDRMVATYGANLVARIAREANAAVLLLGHVAKAEGSEYSGSTAWDAVTRSRWWLRRAGDGDSNAGTAPELLLSREKSNYSSTGEAVRLKWEDGVLKPIDPAHMTQQQFLSMQLHQGQVQQAFLNCLDKLTKQGRPVSHSSRATNYAPKIITGMPEAQGATRKELTEAMESLFDEGRIKANEEIGKRRNRTPITGIARAT